MKQLYKKIYEAINTGIQRALVLDDEEDISIIYQHKKIVNNENLMPYYVEDLLKNPNDKLIYQKIINYFQITKIQYKPDNFQKLVNIYNGIKDIKYFKLNWIDMSDTVVIITKDDIEIPLNIFNKKTHIAKYIKIKNSICGHDIILSIIEIQKYYQTYKYTLSIYGYRWQIEKKLNFNKKDCFEFIKDAINDYNGYEHTYHNINIDNSNYEQIIKENYPIFQQCIKLSTSEYPYRCYQPAMGELWFLYQNEKFLTYLLKKVGCLGKLKIYNYIGWICSSTEYNSDHIWCIHNNEPSHPFKEIEYLKFIPLYKKIN
ncbi:MAG: hypothetical protein [Wendovervirus sonii]|uniref:Uncharacterized protein n=1 Tax=phage Lak_Megaphage_Sonny TaxID=3109229 RepID=A0ABZ0Z287_9CAUD|nr:MAG: hypothetical protein [phage Lak_Megaphage_Sonny]